MSAIIEAQPLNAQAFAPFGEIIEAAGEPDKLINQGLCGRFHDRATFQVLDEEGTIGLSLFDAEPRPLPYTLDMVERHPLGSQCFIPMTEKPFLVIVARDENGKPATPEAFVTAPGQAVNFFANTWHGVLTPLFAPGRFAVIDRIGPGSNLEEHWFNSAYTIIDGTGGQEGGPTASIR
ncbi:MAG: ureidoglycolate lyase [Pseudomonadota bacterium]